MSLTWTFETGAYFWAFEPITVGGHAHTAKVIADSFSGIVMRWDLAGNGLIAPNEVTFDVSDADQALAGVDFTGNTVMIRIFEDGTEKRAWKMVVSQCHALYGKIRFYCTDFLQQYIQGSYPLTPDPKTVWPSEDADDEDYCVPVVLGTAYVPVKSVNTGTNRYYAIGYDPAVSGVAFSIDEVQSPHDWPESTVWDSGSYNFITNDLSTTIKGLRAIIADSDDDGVADANGLWRAGDSFLPMLVKYTRSDTASKVSPADWVSYVLDDLGVPPGDIDTAAFAAAAADYDTLTFNGGWWEKISSEKALSSVLSQCDSYLSVTDTLALHQFRSDSVETFSNVIRGSFRISKISQPIYDSGSVEWQQAGQPQDVLPGKANVSAKNTGGATVAPSSEVFSARFISDSQDALRAGILYFAKKFLQKNKNTFSVAWPSIASRGTIHPGQVITMNNYLYGGTYQAIITQITFKKDFEINFEVVVLEELVDWRVVSPGPVVIAPDGSDYAWTLADLIDSARADAQNAMDYLTSWASDGVFSPLEKRAFVDGWRQRCAEYLDIKAQATDLGLSTSSLESAFDAWGTYLNGGASWTPPASMPISDSDMPEWIKEASLSTETAIVRATFIAKADDYFSALVSIKSVIYYKIDESIEAARADAQNAMDYLTSWASDGVFSPLEKRAFVDGWRQRCAEYLDIKAQATDLGLSTSSLESAFDAWGTYLNGGASWAPPTYAPIPESSMPEWIQSANISTETIITRSAFVSAANTYFTALLSLKTDIYAAIDSLVSAASANAQSAMDAAQDAATDAQNAVDYISSWASDDIFSPPEKKAFADGWRQRCAEYIDIKAQAAYFDISTTQLSSSFDLWGTYLNGWAAWTPPSVMPVADSSMPEWIKEANLSTETSIVRSDFIERANDYFTKLVSVKNQLAYATSSGIEEGQTFTATDWANTSIEIAKLGTTIISGGYLKTALLDTDILMGKQFKFDSATSPSAAYPVQTGLWGSQLAHYSCKSSGSVLCLACEKTDSGNGSAVSGYCSHSYQTGAAIAGYNASTRISDSYGGYFKANLGKGVVGETGNSYSYGFYTPNDSYLGGTVYPFTGAHLVYSRDSTLGLGQLVCSDDAWCFSINQNLILVSRSAIAADKRVVGVVNGDPQALMLNIEHNKLVSEQLIEGGPWTVKPEYQDYVDMLVAGEYKQIGVNALGEGGILVCSENGDIENGDYICSSNVAGHGMKQADDVLHAYTVGKALEAVVWADEPTTTKLIACTYHCG